jgi:predicted metalloprotease with PDZ domain
MIRKIARLGCVVLAGVAHAQEVPGNSAPMPVPASDTIPAASDTPYPGTLRVSVDATDVARGVFDVHETIPVAGGPVVLLYPEWLPGNHSPTGPVTSVAGLEITANGRPVAWTRDPVDVYAFHVDAPANARALELHFQYLSPTDPAQGRVEMTDTMLSLEWPQVSFYPAGTFVRQIPVAARATYPAGWSSASALPSHIAGASTVYQTTSYDVLADSPVIAGANFRSIVLSPKVTLDIVADNALELAATPEQIAAHARLAEQAQLLFGAQHYDKYHFLLSISDRLGTIGLEHHRSSEDGVTHGYFRKWADQVSTRNLLPHEFTHSWDGKFRRPYDLWTPDYREPMRGSLLWVYEGQTQFWGYVLQARSGLASKADTLDGLATIAATQSAEPGRNWRPLVDTTNDPVINQRRPHPWLSWERAENYYNEGLLLWLDADAVIRRETNGVKSMDDFARAFFGMRDGDYGEITYTRDDVIQTLNSVTRYDWKKFLADRLDVPTPKAPLDWLAASGYRLDFQKERTAWAKAREEGAPTKTVDLWFSLGLNANDKGKVTGVLWNGPAFGQAVTTGDEIVAVNGEEFSRDVLRDAVSAAEGAGPSVTLLLKRGKTFHIATIAYHGGLRYPTLVKTQSGETGLDRLLAPRKGPAS